MFSSADPDFFLMHGDVHGILAIPAGSPAAATTPNVASGACSSGSAAARSSPSACSTGSRAEAAPSSWTALDLRYGSDRAVLGQPEVAMGILPRRRRYLATAAPPRAESRARRGPLGRDVGADEALRIGWLDGVFPSGSLADDVGAISRHLAAMPARSIAAVKRVVDASLVSFDAALVDETNAFGAAHRRRCPCRADAAFPRCRRSDARG